MIIVLRNIILKNNRIQKHCKLKYFLQHLLYLQFRGHDYDRGQETCIKQKLFGVWCDARLKSSTITLL